MASRKEFALRKEAVLKALASDDKDKSRKGSIDAPIVDLISRINSHPSFFTTSSCSGRIALFHEPSLVDPGDFVIQKLADEDEEKEKNPSRVKKGGDWIYVSHEPAEVDDVVNAVKLKYEDTKQEGLLVFRFEPFILVLECCSLLAAQQLLACAHASGYRESGMSSMGKRCIVGVRSSIRLEVPIGENGQMLVCEDYLRYLTVTANKKFVLNQQRIARFLSNFHNQIIGTILQPVDTTSKSMKLKRLTGRLGTKNAASLDPQDKILSSLEKRQVKILSKVNNLEALIIQKYGARGGKISSITEGRPKLELVPKLLPDLDSVTPGSSLYFCMDQ